jgi:hypothetical protein
MAKRKEPEAPAELTVIQEQAVMMLAAGQTVTATAEAVGVTRQTVSTWANQDATFMAAVNVARAETLAAGADRVRGLVGKALDAVEKAFEAEDMTAKERAALGLELLKQVRLTDAASRPGDTDPAAIRQRQARDMLRSAGY